jgi:hypothetical protein
MNRGPAATATIELSLAVKAPEGVLIDDRGRAHPFSGWIEFASAIEDWRLAGARPPAAVVEDQGTRLLPSQSIHHQKEKALAMTTMTVKELKRTHRATWAAGDYAAVAELIDEAPPRDLLAHVDVTPGLEVLDSQRGPETSPSAPLPVVPGSSAWTSRRSCSSPRAAVRPSTASRWSGSRATPRSSRSPTRASTS